MSLETEQFWAGTFGHDYLARNQVDWKLRIPLFREIVRLTGCSSVLDVGCNAGWSLRALAVAENTLDLCGCDINAEAADEAQRALPLADIEVIAADELKLTYGLGVFDLVLTAGVLIHIPPEELQEVMTQIRDASHCWVLAIEYEAQQEEPVVYRGHADRLWKRPYGNLYQKLGLSLAHKLDVGPHDGFGQGCTAWLLRKP